MIITYLLMLVASAAFGYLFPGGILGAALAAFIGVPMTWALFRQNTDEPFNRANYPFYAFGVLALVLLKLSVVFPFAETVAISYVSGFVGAYVVGLFARIFGFSV